jgi:hypothetical protein
VNGTARAQDGVREAVERYAADVRRHLGDLAPDQVDDLTDGLEADLADALADEAPAAPGSGSGDLVQRFGPAPAYALELRVAAGLPAVAAGRRQQEWPAAVQRTTGAVVAAARRAGAAVRRQPWAPPLGRLLVELQPVWWLVRAWVAYQVVMWLNIEMTGGYGFVLLPERDGLPGSGTNLVVLAALALVSVQWGRGRWGAAQLRHLSATASVLAVVLTVPVVWMTYEARSYGIEPGAVQYVEVPGATVQPQDGVWVDGMQVSNLFVYDADGNPVDQVQVYDDRGRPVRATTDEGTGAWSLPGVAEPWTFVPAEDDQGRQRWNVYPLQGAPSSQFGFLGDGSDPVRPDDVGTPPLPFAKAPALVDAATGEPATQDQGPGQRAEDPATSTATATP